MGAYLGRCLSITARQIDVDRETLDSGRCPVRHRHGPILSAEIPLRPGADFPTCPDEESPFRKWYAIKDILPGGQPIRSLFPEAVLAVPQEPSIEVETLAQPHGRLFAQQDLEPGRGVWSQLPVARARLHLSLSGMGAVGWKTRVPPGRDEVPIVDLPLRLENDMPTPHRDERESIPGGAGLKTSRCFSVFLPRAV